MKIIKNSENGLIFKLDTSFSYAKFLIITDEDEQFKQYLTSSEAKILYKMLHKIFV
jgi:hypothetical protein